MLRGLHLRRHTPRLCRPTVLRSSSFARSNDRSDLLDRAKSGDGMEDPSSQEDVGPNRPVCGPQDVFGVSYLNSAFWWGWGLEVSLVLFPSPSASVSCALFPETAGIIFQRWNKLTPHPEKGLVLTCARPRAPRMVRTASLSRVGPWRTCAATWRRSSRSVGVSQIWPLHGGPRSSRGRGRW